MPLKRTRYRTLLLSANPVDTTPLRLDQEAREIQEALESSNRRHELSFKTAVRPRDIPRRLRTFRPNIVHFIGHGGTDGSLILENIDGHSNPVPKDALAALFRFFREVECVILNCCHSAAQAELISKSVPFVIGMNAAIGDRAALEFSAGFYQALVDGESISDSFEQALVGMQLANMPIDALAPVLYADTKSHSDRSKEDRDGQCPTIQNGARNPADAITVTPAVKVTPIPTLEGLAQMPWEEFETFALRVIEAKYRGTNIHISLDRNEWNDGKECEAHYLLGISIESDSQISYRIWIELALRRLKNVTRSDVAPHLANAVAGKFGKMIIITNKSFSQSLSPLLESISIQTGIQYELINGSALVEHAQNFLSPPRSATTGASQEVEPAQESEIVKLTWWYTLSPLDRRPQALHRAPVTLRADRPFFLVVEAQFTGNSRAYRISLKVKAPSQEIAIYPYPPSAGTNEIWGGASEQVRQTFVVWPNFCSESLLSQISVEIKSDRPLIVERVALNSVRNPHALLARSDLKNQQKIVSSLSDSIRDWKHKSSHFSSLLIAPPGLGKSFIVSKLRQRCHAENILELFFDCESTRTDVDLLIGLLCGLLPFPSSLLDDEIREPMVAWFARIGLDQELARQIAEDLCCGEPQGLRIGARSRLDVACALLSYFAAENPMLLVLEDLHKAAPSLLAFISALLSRRASSGECSVLFFASTRPFYAGTPNLRHDWLEALGGICSADRNAIYELGAPSHNEARGMLTSSISGLEEYQADVILRAVGGTPYSIREAILFLLAKGTLAISGSSERSSLVVLDPLGGQSAASSSDISRATESRLQLLLGNQPEWLRLFLMGGAVYGRQFPVSLILKALGLSDDASLAAAIETCARWSILSSSPGNMDYLEFDHDLVRESLLALGPTRSRRTVSKSMLDMIDSGGDPTTRGRLAYQAGLADVCLQATSASREQARAEGRIADVVELNQLAMQVLDPGIAEDVLSALLETGDYNLVDPALRNISPPEFAAPPEVRLEQVLDLLLDNINCLSTVGSGSSGATEAAITEARMVVEKLGKESVVAHLIYLEGRMWFERNVVPRALELHQRAEDLFAQRRHAKSSARAENLIREAICLRTMGFSDKSISVLIKAARLCPSGDWVTLNKVRSNLGAAFLYSDWSMVRYHWVRQIQQARRKRLTSRVVHGMASLGFIELFEGNLEQGLEMSRAALDLGEKLRLDGQILRLCLNLSIHSALTGKMKESKAYLVKAEELALRHRVGRRLWRITGNLATVCELLGDVERSRVRDLQTVEQMKDMLPGVRLDGREILPFVNIALRAASNEEFRSVLAELPARVASAAQSYSMLLLGGRRDELPGLLGKYAAQFSIGPRFLISE